MIIRRYAIRSGIEMGRLLGMFEADITDPSGDEETVE